MFINYAMKWVHDLLKEEMKLVEEEFKKNLKSRVALISRVGEYMLLSGGKRIRPTILILSAKMSGYKGNRYITLASIIEFIHTATLLHDDVVDNASLRRGNASANSLWGSEASVLIGDFLFCKSFSLLVSDSDLKILETIASATTQMSEGEILELIRTADTKISEEEYIQLITSKTAVLMAAASKIGGILGEVSSDYIEALEKFGLNLGIAFQLMDDCLDYTGDPKEFGKEIGIDLKEGKVTLPLIQTIKKCNKDEKKVISDILLSEEIEREKFEEVKRLIYHYGGVEYTIKRAKDFIKTAKSYLTLFPSSNEKKALLDVADYVIKRRL